MTNQKGRPSELFDFDSEDVAADGGLDETVVDVVREAAPEWDILAVDVADDLGDALLLLVYRRKVSDEGNLILSERYFRFDETVPAESEFTKNGIERRVVGGLGTFLKVAYAALANGDLSPDDPMLVDSREGTLDYNPEVLVDALGDALSEDEEDTDEVVDHSREVVEGDGREAECEKCGKTGIVGEDLVNFGGGIVDAFVHDGPCPTDGGETDE